MSTFNIQWSSARPDSLSQERYAQFFALIHQGQVAFLGKAYREEIESLIPACLVHLNLDPLSTTVHLGRIVGVGQGHISNRAVDAILSALVFAKKPSLNRVGKYRHEPVMDMQVSNVGLPGLPNQLRVQDGCVIVAAKPSAVYSVPAC
ncbi:MAG: hypothetical protein U0176_20030 [Bacteroidia bacterium]